MVDTPADELLARLAAGKVYRPAQAERAAKNFFRKGNLMALRELALRRTADRVEDDVQAYRTDRAIAQVWKTEGALLCCIGPHAGAEHVVRSTARLAQQLAVTWHAVYGETPALQRLDGARREGILQTVKLARDLGASTAVVPAQQVAQALVDHARRHNLSKLVLGNSRPARWLGLLGLHGRLGPAIARLAPDIDRFEGGLTQPARAAPAPRAASAALSGTAVDAGDGGRRRRYLWALAACAGTTLFTHVRVPYFALANIVMVFLLAVVGVGVWLGRGPAVLAAFLNVAAFDFFFVEPRLSFAVSDVQYLLTFAVMLVVGRVTGQLTAGLRFQARVATHRETRSRALFEAAHDLSNLLTQEQAVEVAQTVTRSMADMVTNLLDMARIQSGEIRLRLEWQSMEELIGSALHAAQAALGPRRLTVQIAPEVPLVECDAVLIERVLANLLETAAKYTPAGSPVEIDVRPVVAAAGDAGELRVSVCDHGPGVPQGQEAAIFEKYTRGHAESATPGMGLGLAICRAIVEAHRGRITVEPTGATGATFSFTLPLGTPPAIDLSEDVPTTGPRDQGPQPEH